MSASDICEIGAYVLVGIAMLIALISLCNFMQRLADKNEAREIAEWERKTKDMEWEDLSPECKDFNKQLGFNKEGWESFVELLGNRPKPVKHPKYEIIKRFPQRFTEDEMDALIDKALPLKHRSLSMYQNDEDSTAIDIPRPKLVYQAGRQSSGTRRIDGPIEELKGCCSFLVLLGTALTVMPLGGAFIWLCWKVGDFFIRWMSKSEWNM